MVCLILGRSELEISCEALLWLEQSYLILTVPVHARPREDWSYFERRIDPIVKIVKKLVVKTLGDGLIDPRP